MYTYVVPCVFAALFYLASISMRRDLDEMRQELNSMTSKNEELVSALQRENDRLQEKIKRLEEYIDRQKKIMHADDDEYRKLISEDLELKPEPKKEAEDKDRILFEILKDRVNQATK